MPECTWKVDTPDQLLYFTFDDGPHPEATPWVLDQLKNYQAKATFFCVGENLTNYPGIKNRIKAEGHSIGNHTYHHQNGRKVSNESYFKEIELFNEIYPTRLFRPPYGRTRMSQRRRIKKQYRIILWNRLSRDFNKNLDIKESIQSMKSNPSNGSIFVFHDSAKALPQLKKILPELLQHFHSLGYTFAALPENGAF